METENSKKIVTKFKCLLCDYKCSLKHHYEQHCNSKKHLANIVNKIANSVNKDDEKIFCICGKEYKSRPGLWKHKKTCNKFLEFTKNSKNSNQNSNINNINDNVINDKEIIKEFMDIIKEVVKNGIHSNNINTTNSHNTNNNINNINNTFNLKVYLNETCKNAMNLSEFIQNIEPTIEELELTGREGYVKGITHIFSSRLDETKPEETPIHCTDGKREVFYVKENDIWNKEDEEKTLLTKALRQLSQKNIGAILRWKELYPDCTQSDSRKNDKFLKITCNSMPGSTEEECDNNYKKIISNIAKKTTIQK